MRIHYELNCGQPVLHRDGVPCLRPLDAVGLAFGVDSDNGHIVLHKHGEPERVQAWVEAAKKKLHDGGAAFLADELKYLEIAVPMPPRLFPVDLLNDAIEGVYRSLKILVTPENTIDV